jgi:predicted RNA-binding protein Jag
MDEAMEKRAHEILNTILGMIGYEYELKNSVRNGQLYFRIDSPEAGRLIGRRAQMVQALQFILNRMLQRDDKDAPRCIIDVEGYRERRKDDLVEKACAVAEKVKKTGKPSRLKPMNSFDRRAIHRALAEDDGVETESSASKDSRWKSIIITPVGVDVAEVVAEVAEESPKDDRVRVSRKRHRETADDDDCDAYIDYGSDDSEDDEERPEEKTL